MMFVSYIIVMNLITFFLFREDKRRARQQKWRIPERTLLLFSLFGGAFGAMFGMFCFHHKTRKWKFKLGVPAIFVLHCILLCRYLLLK